MNTSIKLFCFVSVFFCSLFCTKAQAQISTDISIKREDILLKGKIYMPNSTEVVPTVILLPGFPDDGDPLDLGKRLSESEINALTFNLSGTFKSEGEFNWENTQKDIKAAFKFVNQPENILKYHIDTSNIYLGGYSYGGGMALTYAANNSEAKSVFTVSGNDHGAFMREYEKNSELRQKVDNLFMKFKNQPEIVRFGPGGTPKDVAEMKIMEINPTYDLIYCASLLAPKNIFLIGGWNDVHVSIEDNVLPLYRALIIKGAKNLKIAALQDNHYYRNLKDELAQLVIEWIKANSEKIKK